MARIVFEDDGPGIPIEKQALIFQKFGRASSSNSSIEGLGLGLFIARQIVDGHSGKISVESESKKGARFVIELPLRQVMPLEGRVLI